MFRGVKLPNECSHKINSVQGHRQSLQLETRQLEERKKHSGREKKNRIIAGLRKGWLFKPGLKQTLSRLLTPTPFSPCQWQATTVRPVDVSKR